MSSPPVVTEIGLLSLKPDTSIDVPDSAAGKTWKSVVDALLAQEGAKRLHWGRQVEDPNLVEWLLDWETHESHQNFRASAAFSPFKEDLRLILAKVPIFLHADFAPDSPASAVLSRTPSGIIEHLIFYLEPNLSEDDRSKWESTYNPFIKVLSENAEGFKGVVAGWVAEEVQYEGSPATGFLATLGWESVELHLAYRETKAFQESIVPIREGCKGRVVHHVKFQEEKK